MTYRSEDIILLLRKHSIVRIQEYWCGFRLENFGKTLDGLDHTRFCTNENEIAQSWALKR